MHRDLWLGLLDGYGRRGHAYGDLRLWLPYRHLWLGLLNRDPRCCWRDLYLRRLLLHGDPALLLPGLLRLLLGLLLTPLLGLLLALLGLLLRLL